MLIEYQGKTPQVEEGAFIAPTAVLIGDVKVEAGASIWFGAVLRGDFGPIIVKKKASVQDNAVAHVIPEAQTLIEENVTIAHGAVLHSCHIKEGAVVGMNTVIMDLAEVGEKAMVAAGSVVTDRSQIPPRHLAAGIPAQVKKEIGGEALEWVEQSAAMYHQLAQSYLEGGIDGLDPGKK